MPLGLALLSAAFPPERRGAAIGIFSAITGLAVASGPLVGGAVVEGTGLAVDLLDQRPDRPARGPARAHPHDGELRPRHQPRHPRPRARHRRRARPRVGAGARQPGRLGQPRGGRLARCRRRCSSAAFVAWELRAPRADAADAASSARAPSRRATRRSSSPSPRCSAPCSSTPSCCRSGSATALVLGQRLAEDQDLDRALEIVEGGEHHRIALLGADLLGLGDDPGRDPVAVLAVGERGQRGIDGGAQRLAHLLQRVRGDEEPDRLLSRWRAARPARTPHQGSAGAAAP